ncbi:thiol-specific monooxygenase [Colletotrichum tofieldiae]|uniref:Thiol-specific monooxygenase n=1 Tax=Colletotrichum tofieldiae TaxID=708197 RepID=A0A161YHH0_9PEZI|nr:thiol-specific monooxygenase [Colletotrichum tofieldiae]GKT58534.1 thiol-specific monooxygenase [Colletotrichum tofieldiae]GKT78049.1 thiol-specific monooxygenase [Colletotrichum tofieldiae]GKT84628.1 thiol-specific monooxygenase [Colletotrichum tofieldiae]
MTFSFDVKKIAIIGAGPTGLAAARYLSAQKAFETVVVFEQQAEVGGVWNYSEHPTTSLHVPQTDPFCPQDPPLRPEPGAPPVFPTPMYGTLHANTIKTTMNYKGAPFPDDTWVFPSRQSIYNYLVEYAKDVRHLIKFSHQVKALALRQENGRDKWDLDAACTISGRKFSDTYDAVIIANGHYDVPFIPDVKGIEAFHKAHPSTILHSKNYRIPEPFAGKKVIVVGNGPSGLDIARQISPVSDRVYLSVRHPTPPDKVHHIGVTEVPRIVEFVPEKRAVVFEGGKIEEDVDAVIYCTGFFFSFPFLPELLKPNLLKTGKGVRGLYQHLFLIKHPTLAFAGLLIKTVPWPVAENQAAALGAVWSNGLKLPPIEDQEKWELALFERRGDKNIHVLLDDGDDGRHLNMLHDWVAESTKKGKEPPYWHDEQFWERGIYWPSKQEFEKRGGTATTLRELGFVYPGVGKWRHFAPNL